MQRFYIENNFTYDIMYMAIKMGHFFQKLSQNIMGPRNLCSVFEIIITLCPPTQNPRTSFWVH